jgi:hypothetical protein
MSMACVWQTCAGGLWPASDNSRVFEVAYSTQRANWARAPGLRGVYGVLWQVSVPLTKEEDFESGIWG